MSKLRTGATSNPPVIANPKDQITMTEPNPAFPTSAVLAIALAACTGHAQDTPLDEQADMAETADLLGILLAANDD